MNRTRVFLCRNLKCYHVSFDRVQALRSTVCSRPEESIVENGSFGGDNSLTIFCMLYASHDKGKHNKGNIEGPCFVSTDNMHGDGLRPVKVPDLTSMLVVSIKSKSL